VRDYANYFSSTVFKLLSIL